MTSDRRTCEQPEAGGKALAARDTSASDAREGYSAREAKPVDTDAPRTALLALAGLLGRSAARASLAQHNADEVRDDEEAEDSRR